MEKPIDSPVAEEISNFASCSALWKQMDPWFWPMTFVGAMTAMYFGWALEDVYSFQLGWSNRNQGHFVNSQLLVGAVSGTVLLTILTTIVYSPTTIAKRVLSSFAAVFLIFGCLWLAAGALRHDKLDDAISFYNRIYVQLNFLLSPLAFLVTSFWLNTVFVPIKLFHSKHDLLNKNVDQQYQVNKYLRFGCISLLFFAWLAVQTGVIVSVSLFLPPIFVGMALALLGYIGLLVIAITSRLPHGRLIACLWTQAILIIAAAVAWQYGARISQALLTAARYADAVAAISAVSLLSLTFWFVGLYFTGRMPRILRKIKSEPTTSKTTDKRSSFLATGILILGSIGCLAVSHYGPFVYDLPLAFASQGVGRHHARLAADVRQLNGSLIFDSGDFRHVPRITFPDDLADPPTLLVTLSELDSEDWKTAIATWQKERRMPNLATNEKLRSISQLKLFLSSNSLNMAIDGSQIDSRELATIKVTWPPNAYHQTVLFNTHVDQSWINFLDGDSLILTFAHCTFESGLTLPERKRLFWGMRFLGGTLNDQTLQTLQNLDPNVTFSFDSLEDIQLSLPEFENFTSTRELTFYANKQRGKRELEAEVKTHFSQLSYPDEIVEAIGNNIDGRGVWFQIERLPYGEVFPLPQGANIPAFETDLEGNLIRYSDLAGTANYKFVAITNDTMKNVETLQLHFPSLAALVEKQVDLPKLKRLTFIDLKNLDAMGSPKIHNFDYFLENIDQKQLVELQVPYLLDNLLDKCQPWSNVEKLEVVLDAPPTVESLNQIKTATQLKSLRICCSKVDNWSTSNIGKQKQLWTTWLTTAGITVPTTIVFDINQLAHPVEPASTTSSVDENSPMQGPEIELQFQP